MEKRLGILILSGILLTSFVSAYYPNTLGDFLRQIDYDTMMTAIVFVVVFAIANFSAGKVFKDKDGSPQKATAGVVAFALAIGAAYFINVSSVYTPSFIGYGIGIDEGFIYPLTLLVIAGALVFSIFKMGISRTLMLLGVILFALGFFKQVYLTQSFIVAGIIIFIIGAIWAWNTRKIDWAERKNKMDYLKLKRDNKLFR